MRGGELALILAYRAVEIAEHVLHPVDMVRNRGGVARDEVLLTIDFGQQFGDAAHRVFDRTDRVLRLAACRGAALDLLDHQIGFVAEGIDRPADFLGRLACLAGERLHFICDDREGPPLLACAHGFDRGIEREDIGRLRDLVDFLARPTHLVHRCGKTGDMPGQRLDQTEEIADLVQRIADHRRTVVEPFDCPFGQQACLVARLQHLALVFVQRGHRALQFDIFAAQVPEGIDYPLNDPGHVRTAHGYLAAGLRNLVEGRRASSIDAAHFHKLLDPLYILTTHPYPPMVSAR